MLNSVKRKHKFSTGVAAVLLSQDFQQHKANRAIWAVQGKHCLGVIMAPWNRSRLSPSCLPSAYHSKAQAYTSVCGIYEPLQGWRRTLQHAQDDQDVLKSPSPHTEGSRADRLGCLRWQGQIKGHLSPGIGILPTSSFLPLRNMNYMTQINTRFKNLSSTRLDFSRLPHSPALRGGIHTPEGGCNPTQLSGSPTGNS